MLRCRARSTHDDSDTLERMDSRRRARLDQLRAEQCRAWARRTASERMERADDLRRLAASSPTRDGGTDEPLELLRSLAVRRRGLTGR